MKKNGFTLAEVLISLGLVGVIAAITLPTLMSDTTSAQIGPKLAKAVSTFEQANESLLDSLSADSLSDAGLISNINVYIDSLSRFLKLNPNQDEESFTTKDGMSFLLGISDVAPGGTIAYRQRIGDVVIDINGANGPNRSGTDQFNFSFWNDGSLRPQGSTNWDGEDSDSDVVNGNEHWTIRCQADAIPTNLDYCAGHIFENNLKVLYR